MGEPAGSFRSEKEEGAGRVPAILGLEWQWFITFPNLDERQCVWTGCCHEQPDRKLSLALGTFPFPVLGVDPEPPLFQPSSHTDCASVDCC